MEDSNPALLAACIRAVTGNGFSDNGGLELEVEVSGGDTVSVVGENYPRGELVFEDCYSGIDAIRIRAPNSDA